MNQKACWRHLLVREAAPKTIALKTSHNPSRQELPAKLAKETIAVKIDAYPCC